jgi:hypothetical protein
VSDFWFEEDGEAVEEQPTTASGEPDEEGGDAGPAITRGQSPMYDSNDIFDMVRALRMLATAIVVVAGVVAAIQLMGTVLGAARGAGMTAGLLGLLGAVSTAAGGFLAALGARVVAQLLLAVVKIEENTRPLEA